MPWKRIRDQTFFGSPIFIRVTVLVVLLAIGIAFLAPIAKHRYYDRWSAGRMLRRAAELYTKGDYKNALAEADRALEINPRDLEAIRVKAQSLEGMNSPEAIEWRRSFDAIKQGDAENTLAWARDAYKAGDAATATELLEKLKAEERNNALYHDLAAGIALGKRDLAGAEAHWAEATKLDPKEDRYKLNLATLRLRSWEPEVRAKALQALKELSGKPNQRLASLRALLGDALGRGDAARELANALASDPEATSADKLGRVAILRALKDPEAVSILLKLKGAVVSKPEQLYQLLAWMNQNGCAVIVVDWLSTLPPEVVANPPICVAAAEACARASEWKRLKAMIEPASWRRLEFLREAYLAQALGRLGDADGSASAWKASVAAVEKDADAQERLAKTVLGWGWQDRAEEVLWKLADRAGCPRWVLNELWTMSLKRGDSARLYRVSRLLAIADPKTITHRNNFTFLGLLIRSGDNAAHEKTARALYDEAPGNPIVVSTYALSLFQRGRVNDAIALMAQLGPGDTRKPVVALYYGIFLTAAAQAEKATPYLEIGAGGPLLPEEKALLAHAKLVSSGESAAYLRQLNETASKPEELANLVTWMNENDFAMVVSDWSASLAVEMKSKPLISAPIAEAHARAMQWKRLKESTEACAWAELDYLRNAYLARALDRMNDPVGAANAWNASFAAAQKSPDSLERLASAVHGWGWEEKAEAVLWKLSSDPRCPSWAIQSLWKLALKGGDSEQLYKASKLMVRADPANVRSRNSAIALALLSHSNEVAMQEFAEALFKETPGSAPVASIHALSLYQRGRAIEAMALMGAFKPAELKAPETALYYGAFLTAARQAAQAKEHLEITAATSSLLHEEKSLLDRVNAILLAESPSSK